MSGVGGGGCGVESLMGEKPGGAGKPGGCTRKVF